MSGHQPVTRLIPERRLLAVERELDRLAADVAQLIRTVRDVRIEEQMVAEDALKALDAVHEMKMVLAPGGSNGSANRNRCDPRARRCDRNQPALEVVR